MKINCSFKSLTVIVFITIALISCKKDEDDSIGEVIINSAEYMPGKGMFIINEGMFQAGNGSIDFINFNLKKTYKNITSAQQLAALIIAEPLRAAGIQGLKVYGVSLLTGVAAFPVMAAFTFAARDYAQETFKMELERVYNAGLRAVKIAGRVKEENRESGVISGEVDGAWVTLKLKKLAQESTQVTISARKFGLPHAEIASGVMYRINVQLK